MIEMIDMDTPPARAATPVRDGLVEAIETVAAVSGALILGTALVVVCEIAEIADVAVDFLEGRW